MVAHFSPWQDSKPPQVCPPWQHKGSLAHSIATGECARGLSHSSAAWLPPSVPYGYLGNTSRRHTRQAVGGDSVWPQTAQTHSPCTRATQVWLPCPALMPRHPGRAGLAPLPHPAIVSITPAVPILGYAGCPIIGRHPLLSTCTCQRPGAPLTAHEVSRQRQFCT